jgi:organic hydroperoxide reductase OsmC/OhrA
MPVPHTAKIEWRREGSPFTDRRYSRAHRWEFDGGAVIAASSSPHVVRVPLSDPAAVDPEEAYVAALASCHMLWFLDLACQAGHVVDHYTDSAEGFMGTRSDGRAWVEAVVLKPRVVFSSKAPSRAELEELHHRAHAECYLANSVKTDVSFQIPEAGLA